MIVGIGIDVTEHARMKDALATGGDAFLRYTFTEAERAEAQTANGQSGYYAGRFCVKEAAIKALGHMVNRIDMKDIETLHGPDGAPEAHLSRELTRKLPPNLNLHVSISHEAALSTAIALAELQE